MSNADAVYAVTLSCLSGVVLGVAIDQLVGTIEQKDISDKSHPIRVVEVGAQLAIGAVVSNEFLRYMANNAMPLGASPVGLTPFFVFFLGAQPGMASKLNSLSVYAVRLLQQLLRKDIINSMQGTRGAKPMGASVTAAGAKQLGPSPVSQYAAASGWNSLHNVNTSEEMRTY